MPLKVGVLGPYLQHSQEGNFYLCEHTHVNGNVEELGTAGWEGVEVQASAEDVQVCSQGFHS